MEPVDLEKALEWRYAVKLFDAAKKIPEDLWKKMEKALWLTPSSYGLQPWKFIVITNQELKDKLRVHSWNQSQVSFCSHFVVFAAKDNMEESYIDAYLQRIAEQRGVAVETMAGFRKSMIADLQHGARSKEIKEWATRQAYIALGNFMTSAAVLGIDACPMEGLVPAEYDKMLMLENSGYHTVMACAAGYRDSSDFLSKLKKVRLDPKDVFVHYR